MSTKYLELPYKVIKNAKSFKHLMAISLCPPDHREGVIRCVVGRSGSVAEAGYIDRSELRKVKAVSALNISITEPLKIKDQDKIIKTLLRKGDEFLGLEDPDLWMDEKKKIHLYFTMPFLNTKKNNFVAHLGHAEGKTLDSLKMTMPVLRAKNIFYNAKELSVAPKNSKGQRLNLFESADLIDGVYYSVIRKAIATDIGKSWKYSEIVFHPAKNKIAWAGEHASPGPFLPKSFIDPGENKILGIMNGREKSQRVGGKTKYKMFSVGLFIYDYELGKIEWVSAKPLIKDSEAKTITFASFFQKSKDGKNILYAHVDDSFIRAYALDAKEIKKMLPRF